ncbi:hypothetical protein [Thioalkalivibrio thiocyanodenitrificans]|uniref:hypothetical protein n=1 Tax=Thioalkalivibrio thiocyanodenitrificans TaxID=243063 RepID=UPI00036B9EA3|nr:hypothetical protein [Thioalkalivibrio thiocyanodenitrificans]
MDDLLEQDFSGLDMRRRGGMNQQALQGRAWCIVLLQPSRSCNIPSRRPAV